MIIEITYDKGNGVVVLNRVDYDNGLLEILNDESKFKLLNEDPTIKREGQLKRFLCKLNKNYKNFFSKSDYENIYPKGSVPARIYGLPKIHKQFSTVPPFRPVVSSIGTFNYHLARYLGSLLTPILPMEYAAKDTFTFVQELKEVSLRNKYMVSFDVCSLFTNIPLDETINIAVDLIFEKHQNFPLKRSELFKLFEFATLKTNFLFNGIMYDQIDGVAMGSPLAPILANLFMGSKEKDWIENCTFEKPSFYRRYVDDIFCIFDNEESAKCFFDYLNNRHVNIKFTMETEVNQRLPFLDILIDNQYTLKTSVYHKPTYTGLLMNFKSFLPFQYKLGLIRTLIDRTFKISNNWVSFHSDIEKLKETLGRNMFPPNLFQKTLNRYLNKQLDVTQVREEKDIDIRFFKLPYIGQHSVSLKQKLKDMIERYCTGIDIKLVFVGSKLSDSFSCKDKFTSFSQTTSVVYKFVCAGCNSSYIGETERHLSVRINEHFFKDKNSHIYKHLATSPVCKEQCTADCFSVIDHAHTKHQLRIKEGLYIKWHSPVLNKQLYHYTSALTV